MKVFISSVTHLLKEERGALPPFLKLFDHEPLRFEDFEAQDRSSREACLAGVEAADVYVLVAWPALWDTVSRHRSVSNGGGIPPRASTRHPHPGVQQDRRRGRRTSPG
jgi:hypothetical protein